MFSIKHPLNPELLSRLDAERILDKWQRLATLQRPVWLRYVLVKGWTDQPETLSSLGRLAAKLPTLEKIEIFPYNSLAESNWQSLCWDSPLFHPAPPPVTEEDVRQAEQLVQSASGLPPKLFSNPKRLDYLPANV